MNLIVNGEERDVPGVTTVSDLLAAFKIDHKILVVEWNRSIVEREQYAHTQLQAGDKLEIVHFVGGG
jgi:sulfur carrier protein